MAGKDVGKHQHQTTIKMTTRLQNDLHEIAFGDDRSFAYVVRRAIEEGAKVLRANGVAPKRTPGPAKK